MESIDIDRIIEMCWEDRTPFEAIEYQFGLKEEDDNKNYDVKILNPNLSKSGEREFREEIQNIWPLKIQLDLNLPIKENYKF